MAQRMEEPFRSPHRGATRVADDFVHFSVDRSVGAASNLAASAPSNNRFEQSRGGVFGGPRRESMIGINQLRFSLAQPRVAQPRR
jgi:hypothetical protein